MEIWEDIAVNAEDGAKRLVAEYGDRLFSAAVRICGNDNDAEDLVFRTLSHAVAKIGLFFCIGALMHTNHKVYQYEIAERLGISRFKLNRLLQTEIPKETEDKIFKALEELKEEKPQVATL